MRIILAFYFLIFLSNVNLGQSGKIKLVIDPGHGGSDPGYVSNFKNHLSEKDLNLLIAKKLGGYISENLQNIEIIYTRNDDSFPSLDERVELANTENADYFISIHCNANDLKTINGTETHVHSMESRKAVKLAEKLEKEFTQKAGRTSRGIKDTYDREYSLQVLKYTEMTSVLVECGFLTNETEANYLNTTNGQEIIASAIYRAFKSFVIEQHPDIAFTKKIKNQNNATSSNSTFNENGAYTIQIMSSKTPLETNIAEFKNLGLPVSRNKLNTSSSYKYQYTVGTYTSKEEAQKDLEKVQKNGFKDAFLVKTR